MAKSSTFAKLTAQPGKRAEMIAALEKLLPTVADEDGTLIYTINTDDTDENVVWMFELYTDSDAVAAHGASEAMAALFGDLGALLGDGPLLVATTPVSGKGFDH
jgi:quinol monooxygenase YgiN